MSGSLSGRRTTFQPQDQIDENLSSPATWRAASACHLTTSSHACAGFRPRAAGVRAVPLEAEHHAEPRRRNPDREEAADRRSHALPELPVAEDRAQRVNALRAEVRLAHDVRDRGDLLPPGGGVAAGVRRAADEQERPCAARGERLEIGQHVRAVLRVRARPRRLEARAGELVLGDPRRRARRLRAPRSRRVCSRGRRSSRDRPASSAGRRATCQVLVEVDRDRPLLADLRREVAGRRPRGSSRAWRTRARARAAPKSIQFVGRVGPAARVGGRGAAGQQRRGSRCTQNRRREKLPHGPSPIV